MMRVEWDEDKNRLNKQKHGLNFELVQYIFDDQHLLSWLDDNPNHDEERWINLGSINTTLIIVAVHTYRRNHHGEEIIRLISARKARPKEQKKYFEFTARFT